MTLHREALHERLVDGAHALRLALTPRQCERLLDFVALLAKWNAVYNLTAIRDPQRMVAAHVLDSLAPLPQVLARAGDRPLRILDVGSGAGLPGIVWAIALDGTNRPRADVTLVDAVDKKTAFQRQASAQLRLDNVQCVHTRIERWQGGPFELVCSRAYASLADFVDQTQRLLAADGCWLAMKGEVPTDELAQLPAHVTVDEVVQLSVPFLGDASRCVVLMRPAIASTAAAPTAAGCVR